MSSSSEAVGRNSVGTRGFTRTLVVVVGALLSAAAFIGPAVGQAPGDAAVIAARQKFFGAEHVDPSTGDLPRDEVHLSWVSVATFAAAIDGHVVLLDAYIHKEEDRPNYVPATTQDLIGLRPEAIVIGHGHYDHALRAPEIAAATGATIVGTQGHCDQAIAQAGQPLECVVVFDADSAMGDVTEFDLLPDVCSAAVLHLHSAAEPPDPEHDHTNTVTPIPDPGSVILHPPGTSTTVIAPGDEHGTVLYQFRIGDFTLTYHDSAGPLKENAPEVFDVFRALPRTDVQVGAILGFNQPTNGLRDPAMYIAAIDPQVFVPNHHDFVAEYGSSDDFEGVLLRDLDTYGVDPEVRFLYDPFDYVRPNLLRFDITAPRGADAAGTPCPRGGR